MCYLQTCLILMCRSIIYYMFEQDKTPLSSIIYHLNSICVKILYFKPKYITDQVCLIYVVPILSYFTMVFYLAWILDNFWFAWNENIMFGNILWPFIALVWLSSDTILEWVFPHFFVIMHKWHTQSFRLSES